MVRARTREFIRDRSTFFWNLLFPILLVAGFAFAFSGDGDSVLRVGYLDAGSNGHIGLNQIGSNQTGSTQPIRSQSPEPQIITDSALLPGLQFFQNPSIQFLRYAPQDRERAIERLRRHELDLVVDLATGTYLINQESPQGRVAERLFLGELALEREGSRVNSLATQGGESLPGFQRELVSGRPIRYVDWVVPGVIGMNMMFSCMFGVGFVIVRYRKNGVLKRLKATPVAPLNFVSAQAASRLMIVMITSVIVFSGTNLFLNFIMLGSYLNLFFLTTLAILCMISLGLVFASRIKSEELASGLLNLVTLPMLGLSGVFFSLEGSQPILRQVSQIFPLTHFVDGARKIMLEGAGFTQVLPNYLVLGGLTVVLLGISAWLFRWE